MPQPSCSSSSTGEPPLHPHCGPTSHPCPATPHCHHQTVLVVLHTQHPPCCPDPQVPPPFPAGPSPGKLSSWSRSHPSPAPRCMPQGLTCTGTPLHAHRPVHPRAQRHVLPLPVCIAQGYVDLLGTTPPPNPVPGREMLCLSPTKNIEHAKRTRVVLLQPGVNTLPVKLMGARDDPQFLERGGERRGV